MQNPFKKRPQAEGKPSLGAEVKDMLFSDLARARANAKRLKSVSAGENEDFAAKIASGEWSYSTYLHNYRVRRYSFLVLTAVLTYSAYQLVEGGFFSSTFGIINGLVPLILVSIIAALLMFNVSFRCYQMRAYRAVSPGQYLDAISVNPIEALPLSLPTPKNKNDKEQNHA